MSVDDFDDSRRLAPVWRRIMILFTVIAAVPVILWSITAFVRAYVAPPSVPIFRPITATASVPARVADPAPTTTPAAAAPARALAAIVRNAATEEIKLPVARAPIVEAKATTSDARALPPMADDNRPPSGNGFSVVPEAEAAAADTSPTPSPAFSPAPVSAPRPTAPAETATPAEAAPTVAQTTDDAPPAGEPIVGPVPLPPHRPHIAMVQGGIPVPRPRPAVTGDTPTLAPVDANLSTRDFMR